MLLRPQITPGIRGWRLPGLLFAGALAAVAAPEKVVLQLSYTHQFQFAGYYAAQFKGFFRDAGLEVEIRPGSPDRRPLEELIAGRAQYCVGSSATLVERLKGAPVVLVTPVFQHSPVVMIVPASSDIRSPEDLLGKRISMGTSGSYLELQAMLLAEGLRPDTYRRMPNQWAVNAIETGEADAEAAWLIDAPYDLKERGVAVRIIRPSEYGIDFYGDALFASEQEVRRHADRVAAMRDAVRQGWRYALENRAEVITWIEQNLPDRPARVTRARLEYEANQIARLINADLVRLGSSNEARWRRIAERIVQLRLAPNLNRFAGLLFEPDEEQKLVRRLRLLGWGIAITGLLALLGWWANRRLQQVVEKRTHELRASEERYRRLFNSASDAVFVHRFTPAREPGRFIEVNDVACRRYGHSRAEMLQMRPQDIDAPEGLAAIPEAMRRLEAEGRATWEGAHHTKDGRKIPVEITNVLFTDQGETLILATARDITERKRAEAAMRASEERYRTLFASMTEGFVLGEIICDDQGRPIDWRTLESNQAMEILTGVPTAERLTKTARQIAPEMESFWIETFGQVALTGVPAVFERFGNVTRKYWQMTVFCPAPGRFGALYKDITERKRAEEEKERLQAQLVQAQKMESVGRLAGGVAHDFNNMLTVIQGNTSLALEDLPPTSPLRGGLEEVLRCAQRSADLTRQLLAFARKQTVAPKVLDLNATVEGTLKMLRRLIGENIELVWRPAAGLWPVRIDPSQIDQVLANLCVNARDAISGVGTITLETGNVAARAHAAEGIPVDQVLLAVHDTGCGMDQEVLAHLFEPFFTTKEVGQGTGLGLATVYGIVAQNQGYVRVQSEPGRGSTFRIYLPRHTDQGDPVPAEKPARPANCGHETILLVEDEPTVLRVGRRILENLGYTVLTAGSPGEAIRLAGTHPGEIHLLVTDVVMPEMNGLDLAKRLLASRPGLRLLMMSGYTANVIASRDVVAEGIPFIQKPFSTTELADRVRAALDR